MNVANIGVPVNKFSFQIYGSILGNISETFSINENKLFL